VAQLYESAFVPQLTQLCDTGIEAYAEQISQAALLHETRWALGYTEEESRIKRDFLRARMEFLNAYWIEKEEFCHVYVVNASEGGIGEFAVRPGECVPYLPEYAPDAGVWGWYLEETEEPFDVTRPIGEDIHLILKKTG
jgi:hypothetical protein